MALKNGVKNIQAAGYNGARTVLHIEFSLNVKSINYSKYFIATSIMKSSHEVYQE